MIIDQHAAQMLFYIDVHHICRAMENFIRNKYERKAYVSKDKSKEQPATSSSKVSKVRMVSVHTVAQCKYKDVCIVP